MAIDTVPTQKPARADEFITHHEEGCAPGFGDDRAPAALVFNPLATPVSLAAAATARADCLHMALDAWTGIDGGPEIRGIANSLEPIAQELQILLGELTARLSRQERAAS